MQETQEMRVRSLGQEDPPEEGMTSHSGILAWRIPWTESGGLQFIGCKGTWLKQLSMHINICMYRYVDVIAISYCWIVPFIIMLYPSLSLLTAFILKAISIPGLGRSPWEGNGYPLHYFCMENSMDRGAWQATVHRVTKSQTWLKLLSTHAHIYHWILTLA